MPPELDTDPLRDVQSGLDPQRLVSGAHQAIDALARTAQRAAGHLSRLNGAPGRAAGCCCGFMRRHPAASLLAAAAAGFLLHHALHSASDDDLTAY